MHLITDSPVDENILREPDFYKCFPQIQTCYTSPCDLAISNSMY